MTIQLEAIEAPLSSIEWQMSDIRTAVARGLNADRALEVEMRAADLARYARKLASAAAKVEKIAKDEAMKLWLAENESA